MPHANDLVPRLSDRCAGCDKPLGPSSWCIEGQQMHEACVPWETRPSPVAAVVRRLRRLRRRLARALAAVDAAGIALARVDRRWRAAPLEALAAMREEITRLESALRDIDVNGLRW